MSDEQKIDPVKKEEANYQKGVNHGYLLARLDPSLAKDLSAVESNDPIMKGIRAGKEEYELEQRNKENSKLPSWLQKDRLTKAFNENDRSKDADKDKEPDK